MEELQFFLQILALRMLLIKRRTPDYESQVPTFFWVCCNLEAWCSLCEFFWLGDIEWHSASGNPGHSMIRPKIGPHIFGAKQIAERLSPIFGGITLAYTGVLKMRERKMQDWKTWHHGWKTRDWKTRERRSMES